MGLIARLSRVVPLVLLLAVAAGAIYLVVTYRHSPARAKEVLIAVFTWLCGVLSGFFALASVYAFFDGAPAVLDLTLSFLAVTLLGLGLTRFANYRFLKHNPSYRKKRLPSTTKHRWPWGK
ncbi:guanylate cyclase [Adlercreutzia muris]|uniref:guanylate cyclase n=1 Tax=Adlercreutzia muris TaxID=1796610 RepID=UPI001F214ED2|nr:guanylate cyclase [Adlercreutzia muris]